MFVRIVVLSLLDQPLSSQHKYNSTVSMIQQKPICSGHKLPCELGGGFCLPAKKGEALPKKLKDGNCLQPMLVCFSCRQKFCLSPIIYAIFWIRNTRCVSIYAIRIATMLTKSQVQHSSQENNLSALTKFGDRCAYFKHTSTRRRRRPVAKTKMREQSYYGSWGVANI